MNGEIIGNLKNYAYHKIDGLSSSGLIHLARSPAHYQAYKNNPPDQTAEMRLGSAIHSIFLEDGLKTGDVLLAPGSTRNTELYKKFAKEHEGKNTILLLEHEYEQANAVVDELRTHPNVKELFQKGDPELSAFWNDPETGVKCKCRPDYLRSDGIVIDLKTTGEFATLESFQNTMAKREYHWQAAWYLDGLTNVLNKKHEIFIHVVVETKAPYGIGIFRLDTETLEQARREIKVLLKRYAECLETNKWPSYIHEIQTITLPKWKLIKEIA